MSKNYGNITVICGIKQRVLLVPGKNKHSHITCDISTNGFNHRFANISNKMNSKFQIVMTIVSGKVQKVFRLHCELSNYWFFEEHSFILMDQSAYLKRHFTQTSIHRVVDDWLVNLNDRAITCACLLDISKCFNSINHTILLKKLEMYGITSTEIKRFFSYLKGRKQVVKFHQETSECCDFTRGVPQGSVPGPISFFLFNMIFLTSLLKLVY